MPESHSDTRIGMKKKTANAELEILMWILCGFSPSPNGNDQDNQKEDDENDYNLFTTTLPSRLGYNLFSKELLRVDENKDIVIKSIVGNGISGDAYTLGPTEQRDDRRVDMLYLPLNAFTESLALVIIEIQKNSARILLVERSATFWTFSMPQVHAPISLSYPLRVSPASDFAIPHSTKRKMTLSIPIRANRGQKVPNFIPQSPLPSTWIKTFWMKWLLCALFLSCRKRISYSKNMTMLLFKPCTRLPLTFAPWKQTR